MIPSMAGRAVDGAAGGAAENVAGVMAATERNIDSVANGVAVRLAAQRLVQLTARPMAWRTGQSIG